MKKYIFILTKQIQKAISVVLLPIITLQGCTGNSIRHSMEFENKSRAEIYETSESRICKSKTFKNSAKNNTFHVKSIIVTAIVTSLLTFGITFGATYGSLNAQLQKCENQNSYNSAISTNCTLSLNNATDLYNNCTTSLNDATDLYNSCTTILNDATYLYNNCTTSLNNATDLYNNCTASLNSTAASSNSWETQYNQCHAQLYNVCTPLLLTYQQSLVCCNQGTTC